MMIEFFLHQHISIMTLRLLSNLTERMLDFDDMTNLLAKFKLISKGYRVTDFAEMSLEFNQPVICQMKNEQGYLHFVVLVQISSKYITVLDPSKSKQTKIPLSEFQINFQGVILKITSFKSKKLNLKHDNFKIKNIFKHLAIVMVLKLITMLGFIIESRFIKIYLQHLNTDVIQEIIYFIILAIVVMAFNQLSKHVVNIFKTKVFLIFKENNLKYLEKLDNYSFLTSEQKLSIINNFKTSFKLLWNNKIDLWIEIITNIIIFCFIYKISEIIFIVSLAEIIIKVILITFQKKNMDTIILTSKFYVKYELYHQTTPTFNYRSLLEIIDKISFYLICFLLINQLKEEIISLQDIFVAITIKRYTTNLFSAIEYKIKNSFILINLKLQFLWLAPFSQETKTIDKIVKLEFKNLGSKRNIIANKTLINLTIEKNFQLKFTHQSWHIFQLIKEPYDFSGQIILNDVNIKELSLTHLNSKIKVLNSDSYDPMESPISNLINQVESNDQNHLVDKILALFNLTLFQLSIVDSTKLEIHHKQLINFLNAMMLNRDVFIFENALTSLERRIKLELFDLFIKSHPNSLVIIHDCDLLDII